jgi:hypothetical protein
MNEAETEDVPMEAMETGENPNPGLRALGVPEWACLVMANSRRGPWEMSRNINNALPTSYWEAKGLKSMLSRYMELRQPFGTAWCGPACQVV